MFLAFSMFAWSQWTSDVMMNTTFCNNPGNKTSLAIAQGLENKLYIAWIDDNGTKTVKMQLINADGTPGWDSQALTISSISENSNVQLLNLISDGNCAIVVWSTLINGMYGLYASKISLTGDFLWGAEGVTIYQTDLYAYSNTSICQTREYNLLIASEIVSVSGSEKNKIMLHKISDAGAISWANPLWIEDSQFSCGKPRLVSSGTDGAMVSFTKGLDILVGAEVTLWVQKFDESGNTLFGAGKQIFNHRMMVPWSNYDVIGGREDDMLIAWHSYQISSARPETYLQQISSEGVFSWQEGGILIYSDTTITFNDCPKIAGINKNGETTVFWQHQLSTVNNEPYKPEIYSQKISATGDRLWTDFGKKLTNNPDSMSFFNLISAYTNQSNSILIYDRTDVEGSSFGSNKIFAVGIDGDGNFLWEEPTLALSLSNINKSDIVSTPFINNQYVVSWVETDTVGNSTIKGQIFNYEGIITSIDEKNPQSNDVRFLPNPVHNVLNFLSNSPLISVNVYDITGHRILTERKPSIKSINLSHLDSGIYLVQYMAVSGKHGSGKIIKD